jgi:hypothetical protein
MKAAPPASACPLSVVVVIFVGGPYVLRCLNALRHQVDVYNVEIVVPCDDRVTGIVEMKEDFPNVRFLHVRGHYTYAELRALGVQETHGPIVVLIEDHCIPDREWCYRILEAHAQPYAAIGGVVDKTEPDTALNWALYLADYIRYMPPKVEGPVSHLTDCNVSYKRSALGAIADFWRDEFHEPIVHTALQLAGETLWLSPRIVVHQQRSMRLRDAIEDRYRFGRLFGAGRLPASCSLFTAVSLRRLIYAACSIFLPLILLGRVARHVFRTRRCAGAFVRALPALVLLNTAWAWGEFVGYVTRHPDTSLTPQARGSTAVRPQESAAT